MSAVKGMHTAPVAGLRWEHLAGSEPVVDGAGLDAEAGGDLVHGEFAGFERRRTCESNRVSDVAHVSCSELVPARLCGRPSSRSSAAMSYRASLRSFDCRMSSTASWSVSIRVRLASCSS